jgi:hypothetical protein
MLMLGAMTKFGKVSAITFTGGERYYFLIDKFGTVSFLPSDLVEAI